MRGEVSAARIRFCLTDAAAWYTKGSFCKAAAVSCILRALYNSGSIDDRNPSAIPVFPHLSENRLWFLSGNHPGNYRQCGECSGAAADSGSWTYIHTLLQRRDSVASLCVYHNKSAGDSGNHTGKSAVSIPKLSGFFI